MIRFKCTICGHKIEVGDSDVAKRIECYNCSAPLVVPRPLSEAIRLKAQAQKRPPKPEMLIRIQSSIAPDKRELVEVEEEHDPKDASRLVDLCFSEGGLFGMSFSFIILYMIEPQMRSDIYTFFRRISAGNAVLASAAIVILLVPFLAGLVLSVFHAFSGRPKSFAEKAWMLFFAVVVSVGTGLYAGWHILTSSTGIWLIVFALCNLAFSILVLIEFQAIMLGDRFDGSYISNWDTTLGQIAFASGVVLIILLFCQYVFDLHWALDYSICAVYVTSMDKAVQKVFGLR